jgi:Rieske Fe-S protein
MAETRPHDEPALGAPAEAAPSRRGLFRWLTFVLGAVAAGVAGIPYAGYLLSIRKTQPSWIKLGSVADFTAGETRLVTFDNTLGTPWDGKLSHTGVYVRYEGPEASATDQFRIFVVNCAHLGCPVSWFPQSGLFMCPCHGGVYYANGDRASGPPTRGLFQCEWRVRRGELEIQSPHYPSLQDTLTENDRERTT